jgi:hypothetical protein
MVVVLPCFWQTSCVEVGSKSSVQQKKRQLRDTAQNVVQSSFVE